MIKYSNMLRKIIVKNFNKREFRKGNIEFFLWVKCIIFFNNFDNFMRRILLFLFYGLGFLVLEDF